MVLVAILQPFNSFAWNAIGHRLIAQIAYDHMTPHARGVFDRYNHAMDKVYKPQSFVNAAVWLDTLRFQEIKWFSTMHYIDIPFSTDGSPLPPLQEINALWAIAKSTNVLTNRYANDFDKGMSLRVLTHVVGDIHQPLHAATRVSSQLPKGDRGGNLVSINGTSIAKNLHSYWDKGAGLLVVKRKYKPSQIKKRALEIERRWPCTETDIASTPQQWVGESHSLAINHAYKFLPANNVLDTQYQRSTQKISEQQIALAGCRLAALLNQMDERIEQKIKLAHVGVK